jgi:uncharacterized protein
MNVTTILGLLLLGIVAGLLSSMVGIGGGIVVVPILVLAFSMSQKMAQGTSLAMMLPPIGILAVYNYYKGGYVDFKVAGIICIAFILGSYFGSKIVLNMDIRILKKVFAVFLIAVAIKYLFVDK